LQNFAAAVGLQLHVGAAHELLPCGKKERTFIRTKIKRAEKSRFRRIASNRRDGQPLDMKNYFG
jgi:hypothetical protein